jgi:hypothetical protein
MALPGYNRAKFALRLWLARRLPTCKELAPVMSQSLERRLTLREHFKLKLHLLICVWCVWYLEQLHFLRDAERARAEQGSPATTLSPEAHARIKQALAARGNTTTDGHG